MAALADASDLESIAVAVRYLAVHAASQPLLAAAARAAGLSPTHLQRCFTAAVGVSPQAFVHAIGSDRALRLLRRGRPLPKATPGAGLSGPRRLYDPGLTLVGATLGEVRSGGYGLTLRWGVHATPFGRVVVYVSERGVCKLAFVDNDEALLCSHAELQACWPHAAWVQDDTATAAVVARAFARSLPPAGAPLRLYVRGTAFQLAVWQALLSVPPGTLTTYSDVAAAIGRPRALRAVGQAVGANPIGVLIPCHRVICSDGALGGFGWGLPTKRALLAWEATKTLTGK